MNAHQRVIPADENFNNKADRVTCFVNVSEPPSLTTPTSYHCDQDNKVMVARMEVMHGLSQQQELQLIKANGATATAECSQCLPHCLPRWQCFCRNYHLWAYRMPINHHGIYTASLTTKEINSQQIKCSWFMELTDLPCSSFASKQLI